MKAKSLLAISVSATALLSANVARSQPVSNEAEAALVGSHEQCDRGDRNACIRFGFILGENRAYWAQWQQLHPEWWDWDTAGGAPAGAQAGAQVADVTEAPPELPVYEQPPIPGPGYIWTPGYWAYGAEGYYWVPGTWILPPAAGLLWTPGYWAWRDGVYVWNAGYWGPHVGFYGGIDYGYGYDGEGYAGGRWNGDVFVYNRTVNNFGEVRIANVYSENVVVRSDVRVSFNGGNGGIQIRPTAQEEAFAHERHTPPTPQQSRQQQVASTNKALLASENHGRPAVAATAKPGEFSGPGVVAAREAPRGNMPAGAPGGAKTIEPNAPAAARPLPTNPSEAKKPETGPSEANRSEPNPNEMKKPLAAPSGAIKPELAKPELAKPEVAKPEVAKPELAKPELNKPAGNPGAMKPAEKREGEGEHATLNNAGPPKPMSPESRPVGAAPPKPIAPKPMAPKPPPQMATAPKPPVAPHPAAAPHPPAKPSAPDKDKKGPG